MCTKKEMEEELEKGILPILFYMKSLKDLPFHTVKDLLVEFLVCVCHPVPPVQWLPISKS